MLKRLLCVLVLGLALPLLLLAGAAEASPGKKLLFIPIDNRPITDEQTWEAAAMLGYDVQVPPEEMLSTREHGGDPVALWGWLRQNAFGAKALVVSTDTMLYGGLVPSRNHELSEAEVLARVQEFRRFHEEFPHLPIYAFGTILRTLSSPTHSGGMEPADYQKYAMKVYDYTKLRDKADMGLASRKEKKELQKAEQEIPREVMDSWAGRHVVNYNANKSLVDLARQDVFTALLVGCDDSAMYSQTHYESRYLKKYAEGLSATQFQVMSGADELAMMMLCRAVQGDEVEIPFVHVVYNEGKGRETIPTYCNDPIGEDMDGAIVMVGGMQVSAPERADFVIAVSTNPDGKTAEANGPANDGKTRPGTKHFVSMVKDLVDKGYPVAVGDIAFANGGDNALMKNLREEGLLYRLHAYGGWNTATNTTGFLLGQCMMARGMENRDREKLLLGRYLEDWGYQANVRQALNAAQASMPGEGDGGTLKEKREAISRQGTLLMEEFVRDQLALPAGWSIRNLRMSHPWNRLFECKLDFDLDEGTR